MLITFNPIGVPELVNLSGTGLDSAPLSATLRTTVSHSLPWEPWTVMTQSRYLLGTVLLISALWAEYGVSMHTSVGSGRSDARNSATATASASFSLPSRPPHTASMHSMDIDASGSPFSPLRYT